MLGDKNARKILNRVYLAPNAQTFSIQKKDRSNVSIRRFLSLRTSHVEILHAIIFNRSLQKLLTTGIIDYLQKKWLYRRMPPNSLNMSSDKPVTINHIYGILIVYAFSILFSMMVLLMEKFVNWKKTKNMISLQFTN